MANFEPSGASVTHEIADNATLQGSRVQGSAAPDE
jgi:hypothetical protein